MRFSKLLSNHRVFPSFSLWILAKGHRRPPARAPPANAHPHQNCPCFSAGVYAGFLEEVRNDPWAARRQYEEAEARLDTADTADRQRRLRYGYPAKCTWLRAEKAPV